MVCLLCLKVSLAQSCCLCNSEFSVTLLFVLLMSSRHLSRTVWTGTASTWKVHPLLILNGDNIKWINFYHLFRSILSSVWNNKEHFDPCDVIHWIHLSRTDWTNTTTRRYFILPLNLHTFLSVCLKNKIQTLFGAS